MLNECGYVAVSMLLVIGKKPKFNEYSYIVRTNDNRNTHTHIMNNFVRGMPM